MARKTQDPDAREKIADSYDTRSGMAPEEAVKEAPKEDVKVAEEPKEKPAPEYDVNAPEKEETVEPTKETPPEEKPKRKYAGKYESEDDLEKAYLESEKKMHESTQKASQFEQEFGRLKGYVDWDRLKRDAYGIPAQPKEEPEQKVDKDTFFQQLAEKGPEYLEDYLARAPRINKVIESRIQSILPTLTQNLTFRVKLENAYETFRDEFQTLLPFEEQVGKLMFEEIGKDPKKGSNLTKLMRDSAKKVQSILDGYKEEGKREAVVTHEERKRENLPPGDFASKEKTQSSKPKKVEEEEPESLEDHLRWRTSLKNRSSSGVGYHNRR